MRFRLPSLLSALVLVGCGVTIGEAPAELEPIAPEEIGLVFPRPGGDGPPIECRGLDRSRCLDIGAIEDGASGLDLDDIERVIVSCIGQCRAAGGEFRIDVVVDSGAQVIGNGGYGEFGE